MPHLPLTSPALPMRRRPDTARDPRRRWAVVGSVLLHLLALSALLIARAPEPPMPIAPSYDLLFEDGGSSTPPTAPEQALDTPSETPAADLPPIPEAEPPVPQPDLIQPEPPAPEPPQSQATPQPAEPTPTPNPAASASLPDLIEPELNSAPDTAEPEELPQPEPVPQAAEPAPAPSPEPPAVRLTEPEPVAPPLSPQTLAPDLPPLVPPPPLPPAPTLPPGQQALQRPAPGTFAAPMDLNFGRAAARADAANILESARKESERIQNDARTEAERSLEQARLQQERMLAESEILKLSKAQSEEIRASADRDAMGMRRGAEQYAYDVLTKLEGVVGKAMANIERGKSEVAPDKTPEKVQPNGREKATKV
jgi:hypothetical protein